MTRTSAIGRLLVVVGLVLAALWITPAFAQPAGNGLPGGPLLSHSPLPELQKTKTICAKCEAAETAYHNQVDVYDAARAAYEKGVSAVRDEATTFVKVRDNYTRLNAKFEKLNHEVLQLLLDSKSTSSSEREAQYKADDAEKTAIAARKALDAARIDFDTALHASERLRLKAVTEMRRALRLQSAMFQCELSCKISELTLDEPVTAGSTGPPPKTIKPTDLPEVENFIGIVAKCAKCQPLAEQVNSIRSTRRTFAEDAHSAYDSLTRNQNTLARAQHEKAQLAQQERNLYRQLLQSFTPKGPGEQSMNIDKILDNNEQNDAANSLRDVAQKIASNTETIARLQKYVAEDTKVLDEALRHYRAQSALLDAAQKKLATCEKTCANTSVEEGGLKVNPFVDPNYPQAENVAPITAACAKCQPAADKLVKALVARRNVASDIQSSVWLLKGRKKSLARWQAEDDALAKEERQLGQVLTSSVDKTATVNKVPERMLDIDLQRTELASNIMWANDEIDRLTSKIDDLMAKWRAASQRIDQLKLQLKECEKSCHEIQNPVNAISLDYFDTSYPIPRLFTPVVAKCPECKEIADELNTNLKKRYDIASQIQSTQYQMRANLAKRAPLQAQLKKVLDQESALNDKVLHQPGGQETAEQSAQFDKINSARNGLQDQVDALTKAIGEAKRLLTALVAVHQTYDITIARLRKQLADCEKKCAEKGKGTKVGLGNNGKPVEKSPFVSTDCEPCQVIVSQLNDVIGSLPGAAKNQADLAAKIKAAEDERAAKQAEKQKAQDAMTAGLVKKGKLKDAGKDASAEDKAVKAAEDKAANLLSEIDDLELKLVDLKDKKAVADKYLAGLKAKEQALRKQLADCEKKCAEKGKGTKVGLGNNGKPVEKSPFVSTDCEPCQVIVSQLNDVIGSLPGAAKNQADLAAKIKAAEDERAAKQAEKQKAQDAMTAGLVKKGKLKDAGKDASAEDKAVKAAEDKAANLLSEIDDLELKLVDLKDKKAVADKYLAGLKAKEQALRKQLADCEKKCAEKGKGTKVGLGNNGKPVEKSPFVSTDCEPCQVIVSQLNDVIGSLPGAAKNQADLAAKIKAAEDERAAKQAEKQKAQDAMTAGLVKKGKLKDAGKDASAEDKAVKAAEDKAANLLSEIDDLELKLVDLKDKKAVADKYLAGLKAKEQALRKQLADCEKKCAEKGKGTKVGTRQQRQAGGEISIRVHRLRTLSGHRQPAQRRDRLPARRGQEPGRPCRQDQSGRRREGRQASREAEGARRHDRRPSQEGQAEGCRQRRLRRG